MTLRIIRELFGAKPCIATAAGVTSVCSSSAEHEAPPHAHPLEGAVIPPEPLVRAPFAHSRAGSYELALTDEAAVLLWEHAKDLPMISKHDPTTSMLTCVVIPAEHAQSAYDAFDRPAPMHVDRKAWRSVRALLKTAAGMSNEA